MASSVYVETSVISYYTARPSRDIVTAARHTITQEWWDEARDKAGDSGAAQRRLNAISGLPILEINDAAEELAKRLIDEGLVPETSSEDALHIALATVLTWNFRHINNAEMKSQIRIAIE